MKSWQRIGELVDDDCGFQACGQVKVAESGEEMATLERRAAQLRGLGFEHEQTIGRDDLCELVPAIAPHCVGALWCQEDGSANPFRTVTAFRRRCEALGVRIHADTAVTGVKRRGGAWRVATEGGSFEAPLLLNTAGAWGARVARWLGEPVPLRADALMLMITERLGSTFLHPVLGAQGRALSFKQTADSTLLIGGGHQGRAHPEHNRTETRVEGLRTSAQTVAALFPQLRNLRVVRSWAGIEGVTADGIPVVGPSATSPDVYHAFGFSGHGFQLVPVVGRILAELVCTGRTQLPIAAFRINRFNSGDLA